MMITVYNKESIENLDFSMLIEKMRKNSFKECLDNASKIAIKEDKDKYIEENLPKFNPSFFSGLNGQTNFNGILAFGTNYPVNETFEAISACKYTFISYKNISGKLIILVRTHILPIKERDSIDSEIVKYYKEKYHLNLTYLDNQPLKFSNDENAYYNPMASVFPYKALKLDKLELAKKTVNQIAMNEIEFMKPILTRKFENIIFPNSINLIQGKSGVHKSRLAQYFVSAFLTKGDDFDFENKLLGLEAQQEVKVVYIDTERSISEQFPKAIQEIRLKAGYDKSYEIPNFEFTSFINIPRVERLVTAKSYINELRKQSDKHLVFFLDVATDFIKNFNDVEESMGLVDFLNETINNSNVTFILVIHENPNTQFDKARGHLGTELMNKASSQLYIPVNKHHRL